MKNTRVYTLCSVVVLFFLLLGLAFINPGVHSKVLQTSKTSVSSPEVSSMALLPELAESMGLQNSEYHILDSDNGAFKAITPSQETQAEFGQKGFTISQQGIGDIKMSLSGSTDVAPIKSSDSKIEYKRDNVTEWYINSPLGLEQGFTINSRTNEIEKSNKIQLTIDLETSEAIEAKQSEDFKSIQFVNTENDTLLRYGQLYAFDAKGTELNSKMMLTDNGIMLEVNDSGATYPVVIDPLFETQKIFADDAENKDHFGRSVHIDGEYAVVGSPYDNVEKEIICTDEIICSENHSYTNRDQGSAYVFKRMGPSDWQQVAKLVADDGEKYDYFGYDVGISGKVIIVGSPYDNIDSCIIVGPKDPEGPVCADDHLGNRDQGSAYIFFMNPQGNWNQVTKLLASDGRKYDNFGKSVHVDGFIAVVGSPNDNIEKVCPDGLNCDEGHGGGDSNRDQGSAYIFDQTETPEVFQVQQIEGPITYETQKIIADDGEKYDRFGYAVSIFGTTIVVGAPDDNIEIVCPDGLICDLGKDDSSYRDQGSAYVFDKPLLPTEPVTADNYFIPWVQVQKLVADDGFKYDHFGTSVDIFQNIIVIGSPDDNIHFCEDAGDDNTNTGDDIIVCKDEFEGHLDQGSAYVFEKFEIMNTDIYILPWQQTQKLIAYDGYRYDHYGFSVAAYEDKILVGSPYDNIHLCEADPENILCVSTFEGNKDQGSAYLYEFVPAWGYEFANKLLASDGYAYDRFGKDVDLTESYAISGAPDANLIFNDPKRICNREVTEEVEVENTEEVTEENINEDPEENTTLDKCGPKDQGAAYIYDIKIIYDGLLPGIDNSLNEVNGSNATPNGLIAIIYGFTPQNFILPNTVCAGIELGIRPFRLLGLSNANPDGSYSFPVFLPPLDDAQTIYMQAVDVSTCTASGLFYQIITND